MQIARRIIDDLKTERPDVTPPLPTYLRLVPIVFYVAVLGGIVLSVLFLLVLRTAAAAEMQWKALSAERAQKLAQVQADRASLEREARRASDIVSWVEGARSVQPLAIGIIRSMEPASSIASLGLSRDPATATQIKLILKLNTQSPRQLDTTLEAIASHDYRTYNPNQTQSRGEIDYQATLLYQAARSLPAPADAISDAPKSSSGTANAISTASKSPSGPPNAISATPKSAPPSLNPQ